MVADPSPGFAPPEDAHLHDSFIPVCFARVPNEVLARLTLYLRHVNASGTVTFRLYAAAGVDLSPAHRDRLDKLGVSFLYIPSSEHQTLREELEETIQVVADNSGLELPVRCQIIYESALELMAEVFTTRNVQDTALRLNRLARSIVTLYTHEPAAFGHFYAGARHDAYLATHAANVATWLPALAMKLNDTDPAVLHPLCMGALLYDIGMSYVPTGIVNQCGRLQPSQRQQMQQHTELGAQLLRQVTALDPLVALLALQHHERLDGSGYPRGFTFDRIPEAVRRLAVVDTFDALTSFRPHRQTAHSAVTALDALRRDTPHKYDRRIVEAWATLLETHCPNALAAPGPAGHGAGRRQFERYAVNCPATLEILTLAGHEWNVVNILHGIAHDISRGGLGVMSPANIEPGTHLRIQIKGKDGGTRVLTVIIVRCRSCDDGWFAAGGRFVDLEQEAAPLPDGEFLAPGDLQDEQPATLQA